MRTTCRLAVGHQDMHQRQPRPMKMQKGSMCKPQSCKPFATLRHPAAFLTNPPSKLMVEERADPTNRLSSTHSAWASRPSPAQLPTAAFRGAHRHDATLLHRQRILLPGRRPRLHRSNAPAARAHPPARGHRCRVRARVPASPTGRWHSEESHSSP